MGVRIPFTVVDDSRKVIRGSLDIVHGAGSATDYPTNLHVMVDGYYRGCLFMRRDEWVLPDSPLQKYAPFLGDVVQLYYQ